MKASIIALAFSAALASAQSNSTVPYTTSTVTLSKVYTVTYEPYSTASVSPEILTGS